MKTLSRFTKNLPLIISLLLVLITLTACAERHGGRVGGSDDFHPGTSSLGKVALYIAGTQEGEYAKAHAASARRIMSTALARLPATEVLTNTETPTSFAKDLSDAQALAWAKSLGADNVCVMDIADDGGTFSIDIGFPIPLSWDLEMRAMYSMRILDVKNGTLLLHCVSSRKTGGMFAVAVDSDVEGNLRKRIESDLRVAKQ